MQRTLKSIKEVIAEIKAWYNIQDQHETWIMNTLASNSVILIFTAKAKLAHSIGINPTGFQKTTA